MIFFTTFTCYTTRVNFSVSIVSMTSQKIKGTPYCKPESNLTGPEKNDVSYFYCLQILLQFFNLIILYLLGIYKELNEVAKNSLQEQWLTKYTRERIRLCLAEFSDVETVANNIMKVK